MSIVYFLLTILNQKKIIKSQNSKTIGEIVKSQLKKEYVIENIVMGQTFVNKDTPVDIVKLNLNINVKIKYKTRAIQNFVSISFDQPSDLFYFWKENFL